MQGKVRVLVLFNRTGYHTPCALILTGRNMNKFKDLYQLQKQAKEIKQKLQNTHIEADVEGVTAVVDGQQEIISISITDEAYSNKNKVESNLVKALNKAIKRSQQFGAEQMKDVMGDMGLGGNPFGAKQ